MGIGFISFWVVTIAYIFSYILPKYSFHFGILSIFLIFILTVVSFYYGNSIFSKEINISILKLCKEIIGYEISDASLDAIASTSN